MENAGTNTSWVYENTEVQAKETCPVCASCAAEVPPNGPLSKTCPCATARETNISRIARMEEIIGEEQMQLENAGAMQNAPDRFQEKAQDGGYCPLANGNGVNASLAQENALSLYLRSLIGQQILLQINGMNGPVAKSGILQAVEDGFIVLDEGNGQTFLTALNQVQTINTQN